MRTHLEIVGVWIYLLGVTVNLLFSLIIRGILFGGEKGLWEIMYEASLTIVKNTSKNWFNTRTTFIALSIAPS